MTTKLTTLCCLSFVLHSAIADVYMHNPRGNNDRNCRNDNNPNRRNGNRLFDSQNNDRGGYSCPRAYPFPAASNGATATVDAYGKIISSTTGDHIDTPTFRYLAGSELNVEWTNQHGCGDNSNLNCRIVLQYMCNTPAPTGSDTFTTSVLYNQYLRDGTPVQNNANDNTNDEATTTIPENPNDAACTGGPRNNVNPTNCALDGRYGFNENYPYYSWCKSRQRNFGLFTADQLPINPNQGQNRAINTRQNPNGERHGLECPEERDYYPYWHPTPWMDIAVGVHPLLMSDCLSFTQQSQNVADKCYCDLTRVTNPTTPYANNEADCTRQQGRWACGGKWGLPAPKCFALEYTRDNHLGNTWLGYPGTYNWTLPSPPVGWDAMRCVLRIRYNTSTFDFNEDTTDYRYNCNPNDNTCTRSPIADRNNREALTYISLFDPNPIYNLSFAVNTNQHSRTFQDRSYVFEVAKPSDAVADMCKKKILNVNVRGKRGNIVQVYPAVEYDFAPQDILVEQFDCLHIQWIGSDYNPNRQPNDAEGGPFNPNNANEAKADRSNLVQSFFAGFNIPFQFAGVYPFNNTFFLKDNGDDDLETIKTFAFINQDVTKCATLAQLRATNPNDRQARERDPRNCAKLNAAVHPYFTGKVVKVTAKPGSYHFMSTRNNNFSNRSQKLKIDVAPCSYNCGGSNKLSGGQIAGVTIGVLAGVGLLGALGFTFARKKKLIGAASGTKVGGKPAV